MNEVTSPAPKQEFSPGARYVLEKALQLAAANGTHAKDAASQVLDAIELLNRRLYPTTDGPR